eukprot:scaffold7172_cov149-Skeletonema_menzelii.AAC.4
MGRKSSNVREEEKAHLLPTSSNDLGLGGVDGITIFSTSNIKKKSSKQKKPSQFSSSFPTVSASSWADPPPIVKRIQHRKHAPPQKDAESLEFPEDENSTLIREGRKLLRVCCRNLCSRLFLLMKTIYNRFDECTNRWDNNDGNSILRTRLENFSSKFRKTDFSMFVLLGLFVLAFLLMQFGTSSAASSTYHSETTATYAHDGTKNKNMVSAAKGYQARSQVPISIEYANFVELSEFADAVSLLRLHQQQQQQFNHRRLDEADAKGKSDNDDEVDQMNNAIDASWEKAIQDNPEIQNSQSSPIKIKHVPFFWHIPRSGGTSFSTILSNCLSLVQASSSLTSPPIYVRGEDEALASRFRDPTLYVVQTKGNSYVNVDLDSFEGVQRAVQGGLVSKELADVVLVPDVRLGSLLFGNGQDHIHSENDEITGTEYKGVMFALFRHPLDRTLSLFYHKQQDKESVHYDPSMAIYSLVDWVNSPGYITNFMTRTLVGKVDNQIPLTAVDLDVAKEILRRKCVVGLLDEKAESMKRFARLFGWDADVHHDSLSLLQGEAAASRAKAERWKNQIVNDEECFDKLLHINWLNKHRHPPLREGSIEYKLVKSKNSFDLELYDYTKQLFQEQYTQLGFDENVNNV